MYPFLWDRNRSVEAAVLIIPQLQLILTRMILLPCTECWSNSKKDSLTSPLLSRKYYCHSVISSYRVAYSMHAVCVSAWLAGQWRPWYFIYLTIFYVAAERSWFPPLGKCVYTISPDYSISATYAGILNLPQLSLNSLGSLLTKFFLRKDILDLSIIREKMLMSEQRK